MRKQVPISPLLKDRQAFFSLESLLGLLMLVIALSWVVTVIMRSSVVQDSVQQEDVAQLHADIIASHLKNASTTDLIENIRQGQWNYPNVPAISSAGLVPLPGESIMTAVGEEGLSDVTVTVRWSDRNGEAKSRESHVQIGN